MATSSTKKKTTSEKVAAKAKTSSKRQWKRAVAEEIELPSSNVALVKRPGMEAFLMEGLIPDTLMPIVTEAVRQKKGLPPERVAEIIKDPEQVASMMDAMDRIVARIVIEPDVRWHKISEADLAPGGEYAGSEYSAGDIINEDDRDIEKWIYTDEVDFEDKSFLFNYAVGGTRDLERFREEANATLASVQHEQDVQLSTK